jgi:hypothetical protein
VKDDSSRLNDRRDLPLVVKATFSSWTRSARKFLADTSYVLFLPLPLFYLARITVLSSLRRNQPFFFESTRHEAPLSVIDSSFWRYARSFHAHNVLIASVLVLPQILFADLMRISRTTNLPERFGRVLSRNATKGTIRSPGNLHPDFFCWDHGDCP